LVRKSVIAFSSFQPFQESSGELVIGFHDGSVLKIREMETNSPPVQWDSGQYGIQYDDGINPHIAINNLNQIVSVHQVPGEPLLHYRRGTVTAGTIHFGGSRSNPRGRI
jgi:hypothetical protein